MQAKVRHGQARTLSGEPGVGVQGVDCGTETLAWGWGVRLPGSRDTKTPATAPPKLRGEEDLDANPTLQGG